MAKKHDKNQLAQALSRARRSGGNLDSVLGLNDPNSEIERMVQRMPPPKLSEIVKHLTDVAVIPAHA
jgi:hypothetical protein